MRWYKVYMMRQNMFAECTLGFDCVRVHRRCNTFAVVLISLLIVFQFYANFSLMKNKLKLELIKATTIDSHSAIPITQQYSSRIHKGNDNYSDPTICAKHSYPVNNLVRKNELVNRIAMVLQSHSLMYCPVPKVATKTLLSVMLYMHVRDISEHLNNNWTNIDAFRAQTEQRIDISALIKDLRKNGITISKAEEPKSLAELLRIYLNVLRFGTVNGTASSVSVNPWRLSFTFLFPYFRMHNLARLSQIFSPSFTRIIFVRHPFERLASAYKERIATRKEDRIEPEPEYDAMRQMICRRRIQFKSFRQLSQTSDECVGGIPSFEQFIRYILLNTHTTASIARMDYHWQPYSLLCQVCKFQYNFIGKYEMFHDHFTHFLKRFNLSDWNIAKRNGASGLVTQNYQKFYSALPDDLICQLIRLYAEDFRLFNYRADDYVNRTTLIQSCK